MESTMKRVASVMRAAVLMALLCPLFLLAQIPYGFVQTTATAPSLAMGQFAAAWTNLSSTHQLGLLGCVSAFPQTVSGRFDAYGHFSVLLADTAQICPSPSTWAFTFTFSCSVGSTPTAFHIQIAVTGGGAIEDISAQIAAALPPTQCSGGGGGGTGTGTVLPSQQFSIFYQPVPGTQSVSQGDSKATTDGVGNISSVSLKTNAIITSVPNLAAISQIVLGVNGVPNSGGVTQKQQSLAVTLNTSTPGWSTSFPGFGGQGWQVSKGAEITQTANGSGIAQSLSVIMNKYAIGDAQAIEATVICSGGWIAVNDEQCKLISGSAYEDGAQGGAGVYTGTCATGCTAGSTQVNTTPVNATGHQGTGRPAIDTSQAPTSTIVTNIVNSALDSTHMSAVTVVGTVTASTAWGTLASNVPTPANTVPPFTTSETFNVNVQSGTFTAGNFGCFAATFHDQALITAVGTPSGGVQSVTVAAHRQHASGGEFFEGGMCGNFLEFTAYTTASGGSTYRYLYDIVGSTDTHTLQAVIWWTGNAQPLSKFPNNFVPTNLYGCFNAGTLTNSGTTTITGTLSSFCTPSYGGVTQFNQATLYISGSSDSALNGNCTASTWSDSTHFTCTQAGLSGTHTGTGAAVQLSATGVNGLNNVNIWPGAAVLDVQDETTTPPAVNGALTIEPNNIAFAPGDTIEEPHHITQELQGIFINQSPLNAITQFGNAATIGMGNRAQGGGPSTVSNAALALSGGGTDSNYLGLGGWWVPPNGINFTHSFNTFLQTDHAPPPNQAFINILPVTAQKNDVNSCYFLFSMTHSTGNATWKDCPNSGNDTITTGGNFLLNPTGTATYTASSHIFNGPVITNAEFNNGTCTTAATIAALNGNRQKITLTNADTCALTFTQPATGTISITLRVIQSSVSTFNGGISGGLWPGGVTPTITQTTGAVDFITCYLNGTNTYCVASQDFR